MSGPTQREVDEAVAGAFGRPSVVASEADRAAASAFGRSVPGDAALLRDLEEVGLTSMGARSVARDVADGASPEWAVGVASVFGLVPGRLPASVEAGAVQVLHRHGFVSETTPPGASAGAQAVGLVAEARDRLAAAYLVASPQYGTEGATRYAEAAVKSWLETGARQGWSERQVVEALDGQRATLVARTRKAAQR